MISVLLILIQEPLVVGRSVTFSESTELILLSEPGHALKLTVTQLGCDVLTQLKHDTDVLAEWDSSRGSRGVETIIYPNTQYRQLQLVFNVKDREEGGQYGVHWVSQEALLPFHRRAFEVSQLLLDGERFHQLDTKESLEQAELLYRKVIQMCTGHDSLKEYLATAHSHLGHVRMVLGDYDEAQTLYSMALEQFSSLNDAWGIGRAHNNLGHLTQQLGRMDEALGHYQQALEFRQKAGDMEGVLNTRNNLATAYAVRGDLRLSLSMFQDAAASPGVEPKLRANMLANIGYIHQVLGNLAKAVGPLREAVKIQAELNDQRGLSITRNNLAAVYQNLGQTQRSESLFHEALEGFLSVGDVRGEAHALMNLGVLRSREGDWNQAYTYQSRAVKRLTDLGEQTACVDAMCNLARVLFKQGHKTEATATFTKAVEMADSASYPMGRVKAALQQAHCALDANDFGAASQLYNECKKRARDLGSPAFELEAVFGLSLLHVAQNQWPQALTEAMAAVDLVDNMRVQVEQGRHRTWFLANRASVFDHAIRMMDHSSEEDRVRKRLLLVERTRSRTLLDLLSLSEAKYREVPAPLHLEEQSMGDKIRLVQTQLSKSHEDQRKSLIEMLDELTEMHERKLLEMRDISSQFARSHGPLPTTLLDEKTAVVVTYVSEPDSFLFIWRKEGVFEHRIPGRRDLQDRTDVLVELLKKPIHRQLNRLDAELHGLWTDVLGAGARHLEGITDLVFVLDGPLLQVPPVCWVSDLTNRVYLIDQFDVQAVPSIRSWAMIHANRPNHLRRVLAYAHPFENGVPPSSANRDFGPLPYSTMEVAEIAALYGENALVLSGHQASETSLKLLCSNADTIHIASHAFVNDDSMELSGILMAQDDENDGMLQLFEIMQLKLDSACVVLSACNTSKGSSFWGEGMVGFAHAFFCGCPFVGTFVVACTRPFNRRVDAPISPRIRIHLRRRPRASTGSMLFER